MSKRRGIISYEKLSLEQKKQILRDYPDGYINHLTSIKTPTGEVLDALIWETEEVVYLVKVNKLTPKMKASIENDDEDEIDKSPKQAHSFSVDLAAAKPLLIQEVIQEKEERIVIQDSELNTVLGGGIVPGSIVLLGGDPGIGKSTLLLQLAITESLKVLYVSGEESDRQIRMRADRLGLKKKKRKNLMMN